MFYFILVNEMQKGGLCNKRARVNYAFLKEQ